MTPSLSVPAGPQAARRAADDAVAMCADLLRINTANDGDHPERPAAEYVAARLAEAGLTPTLTEAAPGRASVLARLRGVGDGPALLVHAHLDTVPADPREWTVDPYSGAVRDGCLWGRGAIDMKDMVAMALAVARSYASGGRAPARDIVFAFVADEEAGGHYGARHLVTEHRDHLADCRHAIGEIGGFAGTLPDGRRLYPIQVAEKGVHWVRLRARRGPGVPDPVQALCEAVARIARHPYPHDVPDSARSFLDALAAHTGLALDPDDPELPGTIRELLPTFAPMASVDLADSAAPTTLSSSRVPVPAADDIAEATIDGRFLPGHADSFHALLGELAGPGIEMEVIRHGAAVQTPATGPFYRSLRAALRSEDPEALTAPYLLSAGTDAKWFATLGIDCYGFSPLLLPASFDFARMFHGPDERVPLAALAFGTRVLDRLFATPAATTGLPGEGPDAWTLGCR